MHALNPSKFRWIPLILETYSNSDCSTTLVMGFLAHYRKRRPKEE